MEKVRFVCINGELLIETTKLSLLTSIPNKIIKFFHRNTSFYLGRGNSLCPNLLLQVGLFPQSTYMGQKGGKTGSFVGHFAQVSWRFPLPFHFLKYNFKHYNVFLT
jgi:hypothetical protein